MIAGLLNLLLIHDAFSGAPGRAPRPDDEDEDDEDTEDEEPATAAAAPAAPTVAKEPAPASSEASGG